MPISDPPSLFLSALRDLTVTADITVATIKPLSLFTAPRLASVTMGVELLQSMSPHLLLAALQQAQSHNSLCSVSLFEIEDPETLMAGPDAWEMALMGGARDPVPFKIDQDVLQVLSAFPLLSSLSIIPSDTEDVTDESLLFLVAALQGAPFMDELTLRVEATSVPDDTGSPSSSSSARSVAVPPGSGKLPENPVSRSTSSLKCINVCTSPLGPSTAFRGWLSKHHPLVNLGLDYFAPLHTAMNIIYHPSTRGSLFQDVISTECNS